jgi:transcription elongation GreA/GreB family factor
VHESSDSQGSEEEQFSYELVVEPGDAVEVEFTEHEPPKRATYVISLNNHCTGNGVVGIDTPIGRVLLGAAVGDDLIFPDTNESTIVMGIFKGRDAPEHSGSTGKAYSPTEDRPSLH